MPKLILTRGIPASGKTTWAKAWLLEDPEHRARSNRDDIRAMLGFPPIGDHAQEQRVTKIQRQIVEHCLTEGYDVVVDDTNLRAKFVKDWLRFAAKLGAEVEFQDFPISLEEAMYRDAMREARKERYVTAEVIENFYNKLTPKGVLPPVPALDGADAPVTFAPYIPVADQGPYCILVDIDGTLAHMDDRRSPYDPTKYHLDRFDPVVAEVARTYAEKLSSKIIVMSGRDERYRAETEKWLWRYDFRYHKLYMRPAKDTRNDAVVKNELFEKYIAGKYNVDFVLDDRDRVVAMWRAKGLKVLQVAEGNF